MPLSHGKSAASFAKNVATEMHHDKPLKQSLAIAYAIKRKAQHKAHGGQMKSEWHARPCVAHGAYACDECGMAEGGFVSKEEASGYHSMPKEHEKRDSIAMHEDEKSLNQHGEHESGPKGMDDDSQHHHETYYSHAVENQSFPEDEEDMVGRIMKKRSMSYAKGGMAKHRGGDDYPGYMSEGGRVANESTDHPSEMPNEFDDLVKDDDLEQHYTGANSGDEIGDEGEDERRHDIVSRIMRSRRLRDRNPRPA